MAGPLNAFQAIEEVQSAICQAAPIVILMDVIGFVIFGFAAWWIYKNRMNAGNVWKGALVISALIALYFAYDGLKNVMFFAGGCR